MMLTKEKIENRIKELDAAIIQQGHYVQQMNNQILMFHGAKEEYNVLLKQLLESERLAEEEAKKKAEEEANKQSEPCGEPNNEQELQQAANG